MTKAVLAGLLALGLAACTGDAAKGASEAEGAPPAIATGPRVTATIQDAVSSRTNKPSETLRAVVSADVKDAGGAVVIPAGSNATLTIAQLEPGGDKLSPDGRLSPVVSSVSVAGRDYPIIAGLEPVPFHLEGRPASADASIKDVVVSAGTPIVFALTNSLKVSAR